MRRHYDSLPEPGGVSIHAPLIVGINSVIDWTWTWTNTNPYDTKATAAGRREERRSVRKAKLWHSCGRIPAFAYCNFYAHSTPIRYVFRVSLNQPRLTGSSENTVDTAGWHVSPKLSRMCLLIPIPSFFSSLHMTSLQREHTLLGFLIGDHFSN